MKTIIFISFLVVSVFGADVWTKCSACHGQNGEKPALGKSKILKDLKPEEIKTALNGYKDGTYGGPMKALMVGQVKDLKKEDIEAISNRFKK